jgi:hypothetical protein
MYIRRPYVSILDITNAAKWFAHDQFKPENRVTQVVGSKKAITSKRQPVQAKAPSKVKYVNVECIKWSKDYPKEYERGKPFLPNRLIQYLPYGMRRFHDWYLRALSMDIEVIEARYPSKTFGGPKGKLPLHLMTSRQCFTSEKWKPISSKHGACKSLSS